MEKQPMEGPAIDARVIQLPDRFKVVPPEVFKRSGDQFTLLNLAGSTVHVSFPVLPTEPRDADIPHRMSKTFAILNAEPGVYEYLVQLALSDGSRTFSLRAGGNSDPQIIIDF
jgi:hypothetical protein